MTFNNAPVLYAVGDIHGYIDSLHSALRLIEKDGGPEAPIVFLGDYTDRGPDSRAVVDFLMNGVQAGRNWMVLRGNHDRMFCRYVTDGTEHDDRILSGKGWLHPNLGGPTTLQSYGVSPKGDNLLERAQSAVPQEHIDFLRSRPLWLETEDKIFVHAGIRPDVPMKDQTEDDLIWIRDGFLDHEEHHGKMVVHGHTALKYPKHFGNRIDLDGGAGYGRPLIPAVFEGTDCFLLTEGGREPLVPSA